MKRFSVVLTLCLCTLPGFRVATAAVETAAASQQNQAEDTTSCPYLIDRSGTESRATAQAVPPVGIGTELVLPFRPVLRRMPRPGRTDGGTLLDIRDEEQRIAQELRETILPEFTPAESLPTVETESVAPAAATEPADLPEVTVEEVITTVAAPAAPALPERAAAPVEVETVEVETVEVETVEVETVEAAPVAATPADLPVREPVVAMRPAPAVIPQDLPAVAAELPPREPVVAMRPALLPPGEVIAAIAPAVPVIEETEIAAEEQAPVQEAAPIVEQPQVAEEQAIAETDLIGETDEFGYPLSYLFQAQMPAPAVAATPALATEIAETTASGAPEAPAVAAQDDTAGIDEAPAYVESDTSAETAAETATATATAEVPRIADRRIGPEALSGGVADPEDLDFDFDLGVEPLRDVTEDSATAQPAAVEPASEEAAETAAAPASDRPEDAGPAVDVVDEAVSEAIEEVIDESLIPTDEQLIPTDESLIPTDEPVEEDEFDLFYGLDAPNPGVE